MSKLIRGSGGGGGGKGGGGGSARAPVESPNTLRSQSFAQVLDLISEGEIEGLVDGFKSIYLDEVPLQNADGSLNFSGIAGIARYGTQSQSYIPGFPDVENEIGVGLQVKYATPLVRSVTNTNVNAVRVTLNIPALSYQDTTTGDLSGTDVTVAIDVQANGGGYVNKVYDTINGKTNSRYERAYRIELTGTGPWDIRFRRISADAATANIQNQTWWKSYTEIVDAKLRYPNSAIVGIRVDASQFSSVPRRSYDVKLLRVKVPVNYNPTTRAYTGSWDGTFKIAWTDNPAWCFYDLVTNTRYGLGNYIPEAQVDKWALYQIGKYCDELVDNGRGGTEPRFTCNLYMQGQAEAFKVVQDMAAIFRGISYWSSGALTFSQDAPSDPVYLYTNANVDGGAFNYSGSSWKARHTVALVRWNDPEDFYRQKVEYVEDVDGIARYGYVQTDVTALGCTSRGQAHRVGRWLLYSERLETEVVTFKTGLEGAVARPGQVIKVADQNRAGTRLGGRVAASTSTSITVDSDLTGVTGGTLSVIAPDGTVQERAIASIAGRVVNVAAFASTPAAGSIWVIASGAVAPQYFRVLAVSESDQGTYDITALSHNPDKYAAVEQNLALPDRKISVLSLAPSAPQNVLITEALYQSTAEIKVMVLVSWDIVQGATGYVVSYQIDGGNVVTVPETSMNSVELRDMPQGTYTVNVYAKNSIGKSSATSTATKEILGKMAPPANVQNFSVIPVAGMAMLSWDRATDLDVLVGGSVRIRHTPMTSGQDWSNAIDIMPSLSGTDQHATAPLLSGTYLAKFFDGSGMQSVTAAEAITTVPSASSLNVVSTITENPSFSGTKTNVAYDSGLGGLALNSGEFAGTYVFAGSVDLGSTFTSRVTTSIVAYAADRANVWDTRDGLVDTWTDIDGDLIDDCNAKLYMRTTTDNPSGSPTWTEWKPFFVSDYVARAFQFKVEFESSNPTHTTVLATLQVTVDMPDRVESGSGIVSGAGTKSVTFPNAFHATPAIGITANAMVSGDYFTITNQTASGFDIIFKNSAGTAVSRTFDYLAKGYGLAV